MLAAPFIEVMSVSALALMKGTQSWAQAGRTLLVLREPAASFLDTTFCSRILRPLPIAATPLCNTNITNFSDVKSNFRSFLELVPTVVPTLVFQR
jgi:hypothetical protein